MASYSAITPLTAAISQFLYPALAHFCVIKCNFLTHTTYPMFKLVNSATATTVDSWHVITSIFSADKTL